MSRGVFIKTVLLLAVTTHARAQYVAVDFFNSFLQPFTTSKPRTEVTKRPDTKHRQANKQKYQDAIFFETDDFLKQKDNSRTVDPFNIYPTTAKPRRKSKTSTTSQTYTTNKPKNVNSNKIINNNRNNHEIIRSITNNNGENNVDSRVVNNGRKIDNFNTYDNTYNNYNLFGETTKPTNIYNYDNRQTTQRTTSYYNAKTTQKTDVYGQTTRFYGNERTTQRPNNRPYNRQTTKNPLLNRPGVKPAVVDENRPPITNRPVTQRPGYDPFDSGVYRAPVNTRPPFETERPISTGVVRPVPGPGTANEDADIDIEIGPDEEEMSDAEKRRLYDICEQKCSEFKSMRVRKVVALPLGGAGARGSEVNVSSCAPDNVPLIIGGQLARIETFPHMALLGWKLLQSEGYAWKCGGSLISEQYVLTAGHCTYHDKDYNVVSGPPGAVQLGSAIYNDRSATIARVSLVVRHPKYKLRRSYHDVALLKLAVKITFSETISPACLGEPPAVGEPVIATGWGKTEFGGDSSIQLRSVSIPIWDMQDCREIWGTSLKLPTGPMPDSQVCAGERKGAKDTCQGDSGGPAQVRDGCSWRVVAVTSVGRSCGAPETPALYARVPRAFVARQVYTNIKTGRDGNNQYGNQGTNGNNNGNVNNNWSSGNKNNAAANNNWNTGSINNAAANNNWNTGSINNAAANNNWNTGSSNNAAANNNWNTGSSNNAAANNNWNTGSSNNAAANNNWNTGNNNNAGTNNWSTGTTNNRPASNNWNTGTNNNGPTNNNWNTGTNNGAGTGSNNRGTVSNKNGNRDVSNTVSNQNNNAQNYNNAGTPNNNQYYSDSQGSSTSNRGVVNNNNGNNGNNNWAGNTANNNNPNQNNRNVYDQTNNNGQTTTGYNQNNYGQNNYNNNANNYGQTGYNNGQTQAGRTTEKPIVIRTYGTQSYVYNDNGSTNNGYNRNNGNGYSIYPVPARQWWTM